MRDDRSIVFDAPYREAAHDQIDWQESQSCKIGRAVAEIYGRAERAPDESSRDPDPVPAERGGKKHGWKIRGEEYVRPDQGKAPPHRGRQSNTGCCKSDTEKRRRLRCSLPAPPKFVDQFHHGSHQTVQRNQIRPSIEENTRLMWWFRSSLRFRGESIRRISEPKPHWNHGFRVSFRIRNSPKGRRSDVSEFRIRDTRGRKSEFQIPAPCGGKQAQLALFRRAGAILRPTSQERENDMGRLDGKVAVITGATSGIGLRTAEIFVAEGAKIVIAGRRVPEGEALAKQLGAACIFRQTDVTVEAQMQALIALAVEKFGRIDCLFNNAGGPAQTGGIEGLDVARFDAGMATLVRSVMLGMKHASPHMRKQGSGSIINNGSIAGRLAGFSSSIVYGAAKAAVIHLTKCVAMELGESGIRVNSISPGVIATGIFGKALGLSVEAAEKTPELMHGVYKSAQPIPRAGLPEDIAHAAVFLASDESTFINGHDLVVDGAITGGKNWTLHQQGYVGLREAFEKSVG